MFAMTSTPPAASTKSEMRAELRARRRGHVAATDREAEGADLARHATALATMLGLGDGDTVAVYQAEAGEPPMDEVRRGLQERGIRTIAPITLPTWELDWFDLADPGQAALGLDAVERCAMVLAPALAVDRRGTRLGQGGGCYDRTLARLPEECLVVAVLHAGELTDAPLPSDAHDQPVHAVLAPDGVEFIAAG